MPSHAHAPAQPKVPVTHLVTKTKQAVSLEDQYNKYNSIRIKLDLMANDFHSDVSTEAEANREIMNLLDEQALILERAFSAPIEGYPDVVIMMKLWEHEVVQGQAIENLSKCDALVKSIFDFLQSQSSARLKNC